MKFFSHNASIKCPEKVDDLITLVNFLLLYKKSFIHVDKPETVEHLKYKI